MAETDIGPAFDPERVLRYTPSLGYEGEPEADGDSEGEFVRWEDFASLLTLYRDLKEASNG